MTTVDVTAEKSEEKEIITDADGKVLTLRTFGVLQESRLIRAMGESSSNMAYMGGYVIPAAMVGDIDGQSLPFPETVIQVDAAIQRVGRAGITAVLKHLEAKQENVPKD